MNREDFPLLKRDLIYFDNSATTLKPSSFINATSDYYSNYSANAHRGDYDISLEVDNKYEETRNHLKEFLNANSTKEIVFTSGTTDILNKIVFGYFKNKLKKGDEVLLTKMEHASLLLPWFMLAKEMDLVIKYIPLDSNYNVTLDAIKSIVTTNTKVIALAHVTNTIGDIRPIKEINKYAHDNNILVMVDSAQSVPHISIDVKDLDVDFLAFSAHKMLGPTGLGVLYGKEALLKEIVPFNYGGGMNATFKSDLSVNYHELPTILEAGTPNIAAVIGFNESLKYLEHLSLDKVHHHELELKKYAIDKLKENSNIIIYNETSETGIILFNYKDIFAQDLAVYLNKYKICVRAGNHCAKIVEEVIDVKNTVRISFYLYNTFEEIDILIDVLKNPNIKREII